MRAEWESKILSNQDADLWVAAQKHDGHVVGFTCGAFDILHSGHVDYLNRAAQRADRLIVAVNSDDSIRSYKGPLRPLNPQANRMQVLAALSVIDVVTTLESSRPIDLIRRWKPDLYIKGGDYQSTDLRSAGEVEAYGGNVCLIPLRFNTSTTALIQKAAIADTHAMPAIFPQDHSPIAFLDRDGTLIRNYAFPKHPERVELLPGVGESLRTLQNMGFRLVIVTNQQGIGLGYLQYDEFISVNQAIFRQLAPFGVRISKVYYCPHSLAQDCTCRKPAAGMIEQALGDLQADRAQCVLFGDSPTDVEAGRQAGCHTFSVAGRGLSAAVREFEQTRQAIIDSRSKVRV